MVNLEKENEKVMYMKSGIIKVITVLIILACAVYVIFEFKGTFTDIKYSERVNTI